MPAESLFGAPQGDLPLRTLPGRGLLAALLDAEQPWEVELGFGKGRYLLHRAMACPERSFLGIEQVSKYQRMLLHRARRRNLQNLVAVRSEALYLLATSLPRGFAEDLHVYFPDPWPKARHHRRRLFDEETVDLVLGVLRPGGRLHFATDHLDYGERVLEILQAFPGLELNRHEGPWPEGYRTNWEAKFEAEGRPILRLTGHLAGDAKPGNLHPAGHEGITCGWAPPRGDA